MFSKKMKSSWVKAMAVASTGGLAMALSCDAQQVRAVVAGVEAAAEILDNSNDININFGDIIDSLTN